MKKLLVSFVTVALAIASAASNNFTLTLDHPCTVGTTQLKAGEYKVTTEDGKISLKLGKTITELPAKMETADKRFDSTTVRIDNKTQKLEEIRVGGSTTRIVFPGVNAD
jgi:hypothetical protein